MSNGTYETFTGYGGEPHPPWSEDVWIPRPSPEVAGANAAKQMLVYLDGPAVDGFEESRSLAAFEVGYPNNPRGTERHKAFIGSLGIVDAEEIYATDSMRAVYITPEGFIMRQIIAVSDRPGAAYVSYLAERTPGPD